MMAETGTFTRTTPRGGRPVGEIVGSVDGKGYLHVNYEGRFIRLHRLAWFMFFGWTPEGLLDHKNNNKQDNRILNLRLATPKQNSGNIGPPSHNTSGVKGVYWNKLRQRWQVQIKIDGRQTCLGTTDGKLVASAWYNYAAHAHFGHFAKLNYVPGYGFIKLKPRVETELPW